MKKETFICYSSWSDVLKILDDTTRLEVYDSIFYYATNEEIPHELSPMANIAFSFVRQDIDRNNAKYGGICERNKINGAKGGRPKNPTKPNETQRNPNNPVGYLGYSENPNDNDNDNDNDNKNDIIFNVSSVANATAPPTKKTVAIEARREQLLTDMRKYANIYSSDMLNAFYQYWSEPNQKNTRMRFELEKTWLLSSRLATWEKRENNYKKNSYGKNFTNTAKLSNETIRNIVESNDAGSFGEK